jgi:hypothetical protein
VYVLPLPDLGAFPAQVAVDGPYFVLLLAADFGATRVDRGALSNRILDAGCVYFLAWGSACEQMHDVFDETIVVRELDTGADATIMTTWHSSESLRDVAEFALRMAEPHDQYALGCGSVVLATVANSQWASEVAQVASQHVI